MRKGNGLGSINPSQRTLPKRSVSPICKFPKARPRGGRMSCGPASDAGVFFLSEHWQNSFSAQCFRSHGGFSRNRYPHFVVSCPTPRASRQLHCVQRSFPPLVPQLLHLRFNSQFFVKLFLCFFTKTRVESDASFVHQFLFFPD